MPGRARGWRVSGGREGGARARADARERTRERTRAVSGSGFPPFFVSLAHDTGGTNGGRRRSSFATEEGTPATGARGAAAAHEEAARLNPRRAVALVARHLHAEVAAEHLRRAACVPHDRARASEESQLFAARASRGGAGGGSGRCGDANGCGGLSGARSEQGGWTGRGGAASTAATRTQEHGSTCSGRPVPGRWRWNATVSGARSMLESTSIVRGHFGRARAAAAVARHSEVTRTSGGEGSAES